MQRGNGHKKILIFSIFLWNIAKIGIALIITIYLFFLPPNWVVNASPFQLKFHIYQLIYKMAFLVSGRLYVNTNFALD